MSDGGEPYCLVLGGGGAKGVFHIGVWRALRELGVPVNAFIGVSIGAIMAAFLAQGLEDELEEFGRTITIDDILALPEELTGEGEVRFDLDSLPGLRKLFHRVIGKKGLDTDPLRKTLNALIDEDRIRHSGRDLGISTVNVSDFEPKEVFIDEMEKGALVDYLMASAAFPGFEQARIDGKTYIDGGLYDNVPHAMARRRGYRRIIASDVSGTGRVKRPQIEGSVTVYIKNSIDMGGVLDFDRRFLSAFNLLGYLETMRAFGRLTGLAYFVQPDDGAEASFASGSHPGMPELPENRRHDRRRLLARLECAASVLGVERVREYSYAGLEEAIEEGRALVEGKVRAANPGGGAAGLASSLREAIMERRFNECPYYYHRLMGEAFAEPARSMLERVLVSLHPELPAASAWLRTRRGP